MKKKIIFINNHFQYSDGTVKALIGIVNNLDLEKFDVTILPIYRCDRRLEKELNPKIKLEKGFGFYFRGFSKIAKLIPIKKLYKRFINGRFDIEVAFQCDIPTFLVCNSENPKAVHAAWMHGYEFYDCFDKLDKIICVSKYNADKAKSERNGNALNITHKYNIVDDCLIRKMAEEPIEINFNSKPIFISVGRHSPEKGYVRLVKIMADLKNEGFDFHLILVGDGPLHEEIKREIQLHHAEEYITLTGAQTNPHKYTAKSDVFICSSFSEGYSTACTEAAILGIPIISTSVPGGQEIIDECECGILTGIDDEDLKASIREVLLNPDLILKWKQTMAESSKNFCLANRKSEMNKLFDELIDMSNQKLNNIETN